MRGMYLEPLTCPWANYLAPRPTQWGSDKSSEPEQEKNIYSVLYDEEYNTDEIEEVDCVLDNENLEDIQVLPLSGPGQSPNVSEIQVVWEAEVTSASTSQISSDPDKGHFFSEGSHSPKITEQKNAP